MLNINSGLEILICAAIFVNNVSSLYGFINRSDIPSDRYFLCRVLLGLAVNAIMGTFAFRVSDNLRINFVTIDFVIDAMCALAGAQPEGAAIFNLVNDEPALVGVAIAEVCRSFGLVGITLADAGAFVQRPMTKYERRFHAMIGFERPYLDRETLFDNSRFRRIIPAEVLPAPRITVALLRRINRSYRDHRTTPAAAPRAASRRPDAESSQLVVAE